MNHPLKTESQKNRWTTLSTSPKLAYPPKYGRDTKNNLEARQTVPWIQSDDWKMRSLLERKTGNSKSPRPFNLIKKRDEIEVPIGLTDQDKCETEQVYLLEKEYKLNLVCTSVIKTSWDLTDHVSRFIRRHFCDLFYQDPSKHWCVFFIHGFLWAVEEEHMMKRQKILSFAAHINTAIFSV